MSHRELAPATPFGYAETVVESDDAEDCEWEFQSSDETPAYAF